MGWESVDTGRCHTCRIYTPKSDLVFGPDGGSYCVVCGPPAARAVDVDVAPPPFARRSPFPARKTRWNDEWVIPPAYRTVLQDHVRYIVGTILLITLAFPIAACVSQL